MAVQGKLVPQDPNDEPASVLVERIREEKERLIKEGKIKKEKNPSRIFRGTDNLPYEQVGKNEPVCIADEVPFDIPDSWEWIRLGTLTYNHGQKKPESDFSYIDIGSIDNKQQKLNETETLMIADKAPSRARKIVQYGDIIYSTVRPYLHNMCIIDREFSLTPIASTGFAVMNCHAGYSNQFLFYYLLSPDFDNYANDSDNSKGVAYPAINDNRLYRALIPVPPISEQQRIIIKLQETLSIVDNYGYKEEKIDALNKEFPDRLKKSILQWAIQGKLVSQDPNDEPASVLLERIREEKARLVKEGKIKKDKNEAIIYRRDNSHYEKLGNVERCIDDEIPFDIPPSWEWARFGTVVINKDSERIPLSVAERSKLKKKYDYYGASGVIDKVDRYLFDKPLLLIGEDGANLLSRSTPIAYIASGQYWVNNHAHVLDACGGLLLEYVALFINAISLAPYVTGTAQPKMNQAKMNSILIAIPPMKEQKRIVEHTLSVQDTIAYFST